MDEVVTLKLIICELLDALEDEHQGMAETMAEDILKEHCVDVMAFYKGE